MTWFFLCGLNILDWLGWVIEIIQAKVPIEFNVAVNLFEFLGGLG